MKQPYCRYCGKAIAKKVTPNYLRKKASEFIQTNYTTDILVTEYPKTKEECAKLTNKQVVSVKRWPDGTIRGFNDWDGESYRDAFFCKNECAMRMGYICVRSPHNLVTNAWRDATGNKCDATGNKCNDL
jgi:hypothetical protein